MKTLAATRKFLHNCHSLNRRPKTIDWYEEKLKKFVACYFYLHRVTVEVGGSNPPGVAC